MPLRREHAVRLLKKAQTTSLSGVETSNDLNCESSTLFANKGSCRYEPADTVRGAAAESHQPARVGGLCIKRTRLTTTTHRTQIMGETSGEYAP